MDNRALAEFIRTELSKVTSALNKLTSRIAALTHAPREQNAAGQNPQSTSDSEHDTAGRQLRVSTQMPPSPSNSPEAKPRWYKTANGWKTALEITAIPFAIGYALVTYYQWRDQRRNFRTDARAWLQIRIKATEGPQFDPWIPLEVVNVGKTAARNVKVIRRWQLLKRAKAPDLTYDPNAQTLIVGVMFPTVVTDLAFLPEPTITSNDRLSFTNGETYGATYAEATWEDIFGHSHWMHFCARRTMTAGASNARSCTEYNDTDNEDE